jgi:hypothetical protein
MDMVDFQSYSNLLSRREKKDPRFGFGLFWEQTPRLN